MITPFTKLRIACLALAPIAAVNFAEAASLVLFPFIPCDEREIEMVCPAELKVKQIVIETYN